MTKIAMSDVAVVVKDANASARWWGENLGFLTHTVGPPGSHALMVAPPGDRFLLHLCEGFEPVEPGNSGIGFVTDDIETLVERMTKGGVRFPEPFEKTEWGGRAKFADPDGNVFWLIGTSGSFLRREVGRTAASPRGRRSRRPRAARGPRAR
jgi:catechol 2,3-dioxygenase-like lactoylglutathione lyase family enzyme